MTTITQSSPAADVTEEAIQAFADRVRAALRDLPDGDVVELTEGLEASLAEQAADSSPGSALPHDGDAEAYAAELRDAAGLPAAVAVSGKSSGKRPGLFKVAGARIETLRASVMKRVRASGTASSIFDFFAVLQPVWWLVRGVVAFVIVGLFLHGFGIYWSRYDNPFWWVTLFATVIVSVQWGRGKWMPWRWLPHFRPFANGLMIVIVLIAGPAVIHQIVDLVFSPLDGTISSQMSVDDDESVGMADGEELASEFGIGMLVNGNPVSNIFAFDSDGKPLKDVQLFDQNGKPLVTVVDPAERFFLSEIPGAERKEANNLVPRPAGSAMNVWNVFPLKRVASDQIVFDETDPAGDPSEYYGGDVNVDISDAEAVSPPKITVYPLVPLEAPAKAEAKPTETTAPPEKPTP